METTGIKFNKHHVTNGLVKARVWYSASNRVDGRKGVIIYAKDYSEDLAAIFPKKTKNESDAMTDYFEKSSVVFFEGDDEYPLALARVKAVTA